MWLQKDSKTHKSKVIYCVSKETYCVSKRHVAAERMPNSETKTETHVRRDLHMSEVTYCVSKETYCASIETYRCQNVCL